MRRAALGRSTKRLEHGTVRGSLRQSYAERRGFPMTRFFVVFSLAAGAALATFSCSSSSGTSGFGNGDGGDIVDGGPSFTDSGSNGDGPSFGEGGARDAGVGKTILYAHDNTTLYSINPSDPRLASTLIGKFDCIGGGGVNPTSMTDIAIDRDGKLYGVSIHTVFLDMKISGGAVQCKAGARPLATGGARQTFYGASFAPAGTLDPQNETLLVGNTDGEIYKVDTGTGATTLINSFGSVPNGPSVLYPGGAWEMSGDIVFLANNGKPLGFATVRDCQSPPSSSNCNPTDTLIQIDIAAFASGTPGAGVTVRGPILKASGCADTTPKYGSMYGIAAFQDKIIGFSHAGFTVSISNNDGSACLIAGNQPTWDGAGVTTTAPVVAPPPR
jgi:hypothetical protein